MKLKILKTLIILIISSYFLLSYIYTQGQGNSKKKFLIQGEILYSQKEYLSSKAQFKRLIGEENKLGKKEISFCYFYLANISLIEKNHIQANEYYQKSINYNSNNLNARFNYASSLLKQNKLREVEKELTYLLKKNYQNPIPLYEKCAIFYYRVLRFKESIHFFKKILDLSPFHPQSDMIKRWIALLSKYQFKAEKLRLDLSSQNKSIDANKIKDILTLDLENQFDSTALKSKNAQKVKQIKWNEEILE